MLTIETGARVVAQVRGMPGAARTGLVAIVIGAVIAVVGHALADPHAGHHAGHVATGMDVGQVGHLVVLVGMVIAWAGIVVDGVSRNRHGRH